jgi:hypothetical protein
MIDNRSTIDRHKKLAIFLEVPKNTRIRSGDTITYSSKLLVLYTGSTLEGFEKFAWKEGVFAKTRPRDILRIKEAPDSSKNTFSKKIVDLFSSGFPPDHAAILL